MDEVFCTRNTGRLCYGRFSLSVFIRSYLFGFYLDDAASIFEYSIRYYFEALR
jgi:hypothetical protein